MDDLLEVRTACGVVRSVRSWTETHAHTWSSQTTGIMDPSNPGFNLDGTPHIHRSETTVSTTTTDWLSLSVAMDDGGEVPILMRDPSVTAAIGQRVRLAHGRATSEWRWSLVAFQNLDLRYIEWFSDAVEDVAFDATQGSSRALTALRRVGGPWNILTFAVCGLAGVAMATALVATSLALPLYPVAALFLAALIPIAAVNAKALKAVETEMSRVCDKTILALKGRG